MTGDDLYADSSMHGGVLDRTLYERLLREAASCTAANWVMSEWPARCSIMAVGLVRLVYAAGARLVAWCQLAPLSRARSDVLLSGARALGIETAWPGWA